MSKSQKKKNLPKIHLLRSQIEDFNSEHAIDISTNITPAKNLTATSISYSSIHVQNYR